MELCVLEKNVRTDLGDTLSNERIRPPARPSPKHRARLLGANTRRCPHCLGRVCLRRALGCGVRLVRRLRGVSPWEHSRQEFPQKRQLQQQEGAAGGWRV